MTDSISTNVFPAPKHVYQAVYTSRALTHSLFHLITIVPHMLQLATLLPAHNRQTIFVKQYNGPTRLHIGKQTLFFDIHRAVHRNIFLLKKNRHIHQCNKLFYFGMTLYMFRTIFPSIIRSSRLYIQLSNRYCCLLLRKQTAISNQADSSICLANACCSYVQSCTPDDGRKGRPKHVLCHSKIK